MAKPEYLQLPPLGGGSKAKTPRVAGRIRVDIDPTTGDMVVHNEDPYQQMRWGLHVQGSDADKEQGKKKGKGKKEDVVLPLTLDPDKGHPLTATPGRFPRGIRYLHE